MLQDVARERLGPLETADLQDFVIGFADALAPLGDPRRVEQAAVTKLGDRLGADRVAYSDVEGDFFTVRQDYTKGVRSVVGRRALRDCGEAALALMTRGEATVCSNVDDLGDAPIGLCAAYAAFEVKAMIIVSLVKDGQLAAMLSVHMSTPRAWNALEVRIVEAAAERLWATMERAKLSEALEDSLARQRFMLELGDALRELDDPGAIAREALARLRPCIGADHVSLAYAREGAMALEFEDRAADAPSMLGLHVESDFPQIFSALRDGRDFFAEDLADAGRFGERQAERFLKLGYRRRITRPILREGALAASLSAHFREPGPVNARDRTFLGDVAERIWTSIERARREREMRRREGELSRVKRIAGFASFNIDLTSEAPVRRSWEYRLVHGLDPDLDEESRADWAQRVHPEDRERAEKQFFAALIGAQEKYESEYRIIRPRDGEIRWIYAIGEVERDAARRPLRVIGANIDVTERKRAERSLAENEARQTFLLELSDALRELEDPADIARTALSRLRARLGSDHVSLAYAREGAMVVEFEDRAADAPTMLGVYPLADCQTVFEDLRQGRSFGAEDLGDTARFGEREARRFVGFGYRRRITQPILRDGEVVATLSARWRDAGPLNPGDERFLRDSAERVWTETQRARQALETRRRETEFARVQRIAHFATFAVDLTTEAPIPRSPEYRLLHGLDANCAFEDRSDWMRRTHPDDRERMQQTIADQIAARSDVTDLIGRAIRPSDGEARWIHSIAELQRDANGRPLQFIGVNIDITERKLAEQALADSEARARLLLQGFSPHFWEADAKGSVVRIQTAAGDINDPADAARLGEGWIDSIHPDDRAQAIEIWRRSVADRVPMNTENRVADSKGRYRWENVRAAPVFGADGSLQKFVGMSIDIDARKRAELALIESEAHHRLLLENFEPAIFWELSGAETVFHGGPFFNAYRKHFGEPQGVPRLATAHPDDRPRLWAAYEATLADHKPVRIDTRFRTLGGDYRWVELRAVPVFGEDGAFLKYVGMTSDIHARKTAEQALIDNEARARLLLGGFSPIIWETDETGEVVLGQPPSKGGDEPTAQARRGEGWIAALHPDDRARALAVWRETMARGAALNEEYRVADENDGYLWMNVRGAPVFGSDGSLIKYVGMNIDIDARKRAEQSLAESEARSRLLLEAFMPAVFWEYTSEGFVFLGGPGQAGFIRKFGAPLGVRRLDSAHPEDRERVKAAYQAVLTLTERTPVSVEARFEGLSGEYYWLELRAAPVFGANGAFSKYVGMAADIDERKRAEQALIDSEARHRLLLEAFEPSIFWEFVDTDFVHLGGPGWDNYARYFGYPQGIRRLETAHPEDRARLAAIYREGLTNHKPFTFDARFLTLDGDYRWLELRCVPIFSKDGVFSKYVGVTTDTHRRKLAEQKLIDSETRHRLLIEGFSPIMWEADPAGSVFVHHGEWGDADDLKGEGWTARIHPDDRGRALVNWRAAVDNRTSLNADYRIMDGHGGYRWMNVRASPVFDNGGPLVRFVGMNIDIDVRKRAEQALMDSEARHRLLVAGFSPVIWETDAAGRSVLHEGDRGNGDELKGYGWAAKVHPEDRDKALLAWREAFASRTPMDAEYRAEDKEGAYRWISVRASPVFGPDGALIKYVGMNVDIDARKRAEQALKDSEMRSRMLLEGFAPIYWETDPAGAATVVRKSWDDDSDTTYQDRLGRGWAAAIHPDDRADVARKWAEILSKGALLNAECRVQDENGVYRWWNLRASPQFAADGSLLKYVGMSIDIDARKTAEEWYREAMRRTQQFSDASSDVLWLRDARTLAFESVSRAFETVFGLPARDVLPPADPKRWFALVVPEDREALRAALEAGGKGQSVTHEYRISRPSDGEFRWIRSTIFPLNDDKGKVICISGISSDVTDARQSAERQAVLLAELQHRVRNIVAIVLSLTARTARSAKSVADYADLLHGRLSAIARTQSLLTRAAAEGVDLRVILQDEIAAQSAPDARYEITGPGIALPPKAAEVMTLAVHELTTNALKYGALATPNGHVSVNWRVEPRDGQPWLAFEWRERGAAPRASGAPPRRGFGSELITQRVPYELRGSGSLDILGDGAVCRLEFPILAAPSLLETEAPPPEATYRGALAMSGEPSLAGLRVLVVEDDFLLANDLERALRAAGAEIVGPAADAEAARRLIDARSPQAAVLDIDLSGADSLDVATLLSLRGVPIVIVSGYDETQIPDALTRAPRVEKPADLKQVVRALARQTSELRPR